MVYKRRNFNFLLHLNAKEGTFKFAKALRKRSTEAEIVLWNELKGRKLMGYKFRRQHPIHFYIADFYCHDQRLIVEVDGRIHINPNIKNHDLNREDELSRFGIRVIRFTNNQIIENVKDVKEKIIGFIKQNPIK